VPRLPIANPLLDNFGEFDPVNLVNPYSFAASVAAWYDSIAIGDLNNHQTTGPTGGDSSNAGKVTLPAGTVTKLRAGFRFAFTTGTIKLALYDSAKDLVISVTGVAVAATDGIVVEADVTSTDQLLIGTLTGQASGDSLTSFDYTYAAMPVASLSDWIAVTYKIVAGAYVE
jgi:hypothetical protein